jgi:acetyl-CoA C-acetyltransferase
MHEDPIVIVGAARTPMGGFQGSLSDMTAPELGGAAIKAAVERARCKPEDIEDVVMGLCLFAGLKQAPARQAAHNAGLPWSNDAGT